jgi:Domain of unknown function (DUF4277)
VDGAPAQVAQDTYVTEQLDHLGIVAGVSREIGLAAWLGAQDEQRHERVGVGTATVAMILNAWGSTIAACIWYLNSLRPRRSSGC